MKFIIIICIVVGVSIVYCVLNLILSLIDRIIYYNSIETESLIRMTTTIEPKETKETEE